MDRREAGFGPRGIDVDRHGVIWTALSGSSHLASFDRRKCAVLNGPSATGRHCREGWTLYATPEVDLPGVASSVRSDYHYYSWVDQFDTLGLGENVPIAAGSNSDSLLALDPASARWTILRVPYPMGFFTRGMDGRIDDPSAGGKGRGVRATYGPAVTWHIEGGRGTRPSLVRFQVRPDPLAHRATSPPTRARSWRPDRAAREFPAPAPPGSRRVPPGRPHPRSGAGRRRRTVRRQVRGRPDGSRRSPPPGVLQ